MAAKQIVSNVFSVGAIDWDRTIFDELIPLPFGTSYNSYLIKGSQKTALIDTVEPLELHQLIDNLNILNVKKIDYIVANHAEQDHSGSIPQVLELFPDAMIITNEKCRGMIVDLLHVCADKFIVVGDREEISLGDKTLRFLFAPWVHWPETMMTYVIEDSLLFSGDFLGSHIATSDLFPKDLLRAYESAKRYYAEIMMPFRAHIKRHLELIDELNVTFICPTHGFVYDNPKFILDAYKDWVSDEVKNEVIIPYVSMHGSTKIMVDYLVNALMDRGVGVKPFNLIHSDIGEIALALVDTATIVFGSSTVLSGPHPQAVYAASIVNALRPNIKFSAIIGSYGWGGKMVETLNLLLSNLKTECVGQILVKGQPKEEDFKKLEELADNIYKKHKELNIL